MQNADKTYFVSPTPARGKKFFVQEWNPSQKDVIFFIHGFPGCSEQAKLMTLSPILRNVRVVAIDRPGYGQSEFQKNFTPEVYAEQMFEVLQDLEIDKVHILSVSGGAPFAVALASLLGERVVRMCSIAGVAPLTRKTFKYMRPQQRKAWLLSRVVPTAMQNAYLDRLWQKGFENIDQLLFAQVEESGGPDSQVFKHPEISTVLSDTLKKALSQGPRGIVQDLRIYGDSWPAHPRELSCPITLWHGTKDDIVHVAFSEYMKTLVSHADLRVVENEGHYSLPMNYREQILSDLVAPRAPA